MGLSSKSTNLRLLSYNIQVGVRTNNFSGYVTGAWRHVLPSAARFDNLNQIARLLAQYDMVALQEVDGGSLRSGFTNQVEYLAKLGDFAFWHHQINRNFGKIAKNSNGFLSRYIPDHITEHKLPGFFPGRGALIVHFNDAMNSLVVVVVHLALGARSRQRQIRYIADLVKDHQHLIVMGDMNCPAKRLFGPLQVNALDVKPVSENLRTFPSWRPMRSLDHILVSDNLTIENAQVLNCRYSDHLPIAVNLNVPMALSA